MCIHLTYLWNEDRLAILRTSAGFSERTKTRVPTPHTPHDVNDAELMARLADGDRSALAELVRRHQRSVLELAYRTTGDRALAEDIAQDAFLRVWRSANSYAPTARFSTWLYRVVVNLCLDAFKKRKPLLGDPPDAPESSSADPALTLEAADRAPAVRRAVAALPERQRIAVVLQRFSGLSVKGICEATGWTESAVESLLVRGHTALRKALADLGEKRG